MIDNGPLSTIRRFLDRRADRGRLHVDRSMVPCPVRGDVELEVCLACPSLKKLVGDPITGLECEARSLSLDGSVQPY